MIRTAWRSTQAPGCRVTAERSSTTPGSRPSSSRASATTATTASRLRRSTATSSGRRTTAPCTAAPVVRRSGSAVGLRGAEPRSRPSIRLGPKSTRCPSTRRMARTWWGGPVARCTSSSAVRRSTSRTRRCWQGTRSSRSMMRHWTTPALLANGATCCSIRPMGPMPLDTRVVRSTSLPVVRRSLCAPRRCWQGTRSLRSMMRHWTMPVVPACGVTFVSIRATALASKRGRRAPCPS